MRTRNSGSSANSPDDDLLPINGEGHDERAEEMESSANSQDDKLPSRNEASTNKETVMQVYWGKSPRQYLRDYATTPPPSDDESGENEDVMNDDGEMSDIELQETPANTDDPEGLNRLTAGEAQEGTETMGETLEEEQELIEPELVGSAPGKGERTKGERVADRYKEALSTSHHITIFDVLDHTV